MPQVHIATPHDEASVRKVVEVAIAVADDFAEDAEQWEPIFRESCRLLGLAVAVPLPETTIPITVPPLGRP